MLFLVLVVTLFVQARFQTANLPISLSGCGDFLAFMTIGQSLPLHLALQYA
jgi:hypothetical protein